jgi:5-methylcytosine-specific restriction endonuclease McrA
MSSKKTCSDNMIIDSAKNSNTMREASIKCNLHFSTFKRRAIKLGCYNPNQGGKGTKKDWQKRIPLEEILQGKHPTYQTYKLRNRLIKNNILEYKCKVCNISSYLGKHLSLELDHINGIRHDHRLSNLRLLCPNCHSQTSTFRSKNMINKQ